MALETRYQELKALLENTHPEHHASPLAVDALLDSVIAIHDDCQAYASHDKTGNIQRFIKKYGPSVQKLRKLRTNKDDFVKLKQLARGQFGEVAIVRGVADNKIYAMKVLRKADMLKQSDIAFFMEEREILSTLQPSRWITPLHVAFQDNVNLYLVMDYMAGGDLASLLLRSDDGEFTFTEQNTRFYIAEITLGLEELHKHNFVHRDLKPGNILIDSKGHAKLADFGSCIQLNEKQQVNSAAVVGTPDYISPEVLQHNEGKGTYGFECDFWSLGIILYELLCLDPPFFSDSLLETYNKIMNHEKFLVFPDDVDLSDTVQSLIKSLICRKEKRLKSAADIKKHSFFEGVKWDALHQETPPFLPNILSPDDTSNFVLDEDLDEPQATRSGLESRDNTFTGTNLAFIGYSFDKKIYASSSIKKESSTKKEVANAPTSQTVLNTALEKKIAELEANVARADKLLSEQSEKYASLLKEKEKYETEISELKAEVEKKNELINTSMANTKNLQTVREEFEVATAKLAATESYVAELKATLQDMQTKYSVLEKEKAMLDLEITNLKNAADNDRQKLHAANEKLSENQEKIKFANDQIHTLQDKVQVAVDSQNRLHKELASVKTTLTNEKLEKDKLAEKLLSEESSRQSAQMELDQFKVLLNEANDKIQSLTKKDGQVESLLENEAALRTRMNEEIAALTKQKTSNETELKATKAKLYQLEKERNEFRARVEDIETELNMERNRVEELQRTKSSMQRSNSLAELEMNDMKKNLDDLRVEKEVLLKKLREVEKAMAFLDIETKEVKKKLETEVGKNARLEASMKELELKALEQSRRRSNLVSQCQDLEAQTQSLLQDFIELKKTTKKQNETLASQENQLSQKSKQIQVLEQERDELKAQVSSYSKTVVTADDKLAQELSEKTEHLESVLCQLEQTIEDKEALEKANAELTETVSNLQKRQELDAVKIDGLIKKLSEVMSGSVSSPKSPAPSSPLSLVDKKLVRTKVAEMKAYEQQINHEVAKRAALESELNAVKNAKLMLENEVAELRKQLDQRRGSNSLQRSGSMVSFSSKFRNYLPFGSYEGVSVPSIQGWLKMRILKERKNKYEWVKRYMLLRDDKLYLMEKEKDKDTHTAPFFIDLKFSILVVRAIRQNELIHLSDREISCAFMIQFSNLDQNDQSLAQLDRVKPNEEAASRIEEIDQQLQKEERIKEATEKMMLVQKAAGDAKKRLQQELDDCLRKIKSLRNERTELEQVVAPLQSKTNDKTENIVTKKSVEIPEPSPRKKGKNAITFHLNHQFVPTTLTEASTCFHCQDVLFGSNQSFQCQECTLVCHKFCYSSIDIKCQDYQHIKDSPKYYFIALNEADRTRWVTGIDCLHNNLRSSLLKSSSTYGSLQE